MFSLPRGTEMFQFPRFPLPVLCVQTGVTPHDRCRVSPFGHPRIDGWSTPPRGLSQSPTSFFGSRRQGIHRWLFVAWKSKMLVLAMEFSRCGCRRRGCRRAAAHGKRAKGRPRESAAASKPQRVVGGLPLQNGTEGSGPFTAPGRRKQQPSTAVRGSRLE